jgi:hypothetical protein
MAYLTIDELKQKSVIDSIRNAGTEDDMRLQLLLDYCTALIDAYVGFSFTPMLNKTIYFDGDDTKKITLPYRIINIISVTALTHDYPFNALVDGHPYVYNNTDMRIVGSRQNQILNLRERFQEGEDNLEIICDFGWDTVPDEIINCLVVLCNANYDYLGDEEKLSLASGPFKSEKIANYEYQIKDTSKSENSTTGNAQVDAILEYYQDQEDFSIGVV